MGATKKKLSQEQRNIRLRLVMGLCITLCMTLLYVLRPLALVQVDRHIYDIFLQREATRNAAAGIRPSPTPAVVDLDEDSLARYGQWPWPRHLLARLIKVLTESGAAAIGLDMLLAEEDRTSPRILQQSLRNSFGVEVDFHGLPPELEDNDALLAGIMAQAPVVTGFFLHFNPAASTELPEDLPALRGVVEQTPPGGRPPRDLVLQAYGATLPLQTLRDAAPLGSINVAPDPDGIVRAVPLVTQTPGRLHLSLGLRALMRGLGVSTLLLRGGPDGLQELVLGPYRVPVSPEGLMHVPFRGPRHTYPYFSAADVLDGKVPPEELQGRVLIVGTSAPGLLDIRATPLDPVYPGVEVHAAAIDAILSGNFLQVPAWSPGAQVMGIMVVGLAATAAFALASPLVYLPLTLGMTAATVWVSWSIFARGFFFTPQYVLLTIVLLTTSLLAVRFWQESRQRRLLRQAFSRYVAPDLVDRISDRDGDILAGEKRRVSLMFTDIRSFTSISEKLAPEQVVHMLNRYFTPMTALIRASSGTVDKFIGDAIMAFWNAPLDVPRHERQAVLCALNMHDALNSLNEELHAQMGIRLHMGVGIHTGDVYVGNMGSAELLDYTCIGDTVNLASRLEGMCPVYGVEAVVSGDCVASCCGEEPTASSTPGRGRKEDARRMAVWGSDTAATADIVFLPLDSVKVKGKDRPVHIYTPLTAREAAQRETELIALAAARALYTAGDFSAARKAFATLGAAHPQCQIHAEYARRCAALHTNPPAQWDGVWTFSKK